MMMVATYVDPRPAQRERALIRANEIRSARREIKTRLASGELGLDELILDPPEECYTAQIGTVLEWMPGVGRWRSSRILALQGRPLRRELVLEHLSAATRAELAERVRTIVRRP